MSTIFGIQIFVYILNLIIAFILFFAILRIMKRFKIKRKILLSILISLVSAPLLYSLTIIIWITWVEYYPERPFSKSEWIENKQKRYELTKDLTRDNNLIGKTKNEIFNLLGKCEEDTLDSIWYFDIGVLPSIMIVDCEELKIDFKDNKVVKVKQCYSRYGY